MSLQHHERATHFACLRRREEGYVLLTLLLVVSLLP